MRKRLDGASILARMRTMQCFSPVPPNSIAVSMWGRGIVEGTENQSLYCPEINRSVQDSDVYLVSMISSLENLCRVAMVESREVLRVMTMSLARNLTSTHIPTLLKVLCLVKPLEQNVRIELSVGTLGSVNPFRSGASTSAIDFSCGRNQDTCLDQSCCTEAYCDHTFVASHFLATGGVRLAQEHVRVWKPWGDCESAKTYAFEESRCGVAIANSSVLGSTHGYLSNAIARSAMLQSVAYKLCPQRASPVDSWNEGSTKVLLSGYMGQPLFTYTCKQEVPPTVLGRISYAFPLITSFKAILLGFGSKVVYGKLEPLCRQKEQ